MSSYNNIKNQNTITKNVYDILHTASTEETQKQVLDAIKNINIQVEGGTFNANDTITHTKLDTINTTLENGIDINNFPSTIEVSNGITVNNFPSTIEVSNGITVNNFPNTFRIEASNGNVINSSNGRLETNLYALKNGVPEMLSSYQPISTTKNTLETYNYSCVRGRVSGGLESEIGAIVHGSNISLSVIDYNSDYILNGITGIENILNHGLTVNNFPQSFEVSNGITVNNFPQSFEVSNGITVNNFPSTIEVSNGITVNNFPQSFEISNGITVNNFPQSFEVSNGITVNNFPQSFEVSNGITVNNFPQSFEVSNGITVNNFPQSFEVSNGITVNNFPQSFEVSNGITVNNFPQSFEVSNGITVNNFPQSFEVSNGITVNNFPSDFGITGNVNVIPYSKSDDSSNSQQQLQSTIINGNYYLRSSDFYNEQNSIIKANSIGGDDVGVYRTNLFVSDNDGKAIEVKGITGTNSINCNITNNTIGVSGLSFDGNYLMTSATVNFPTDASIVMLGSDYAVGTTATYSPPYIEPTTGALLTTSISQGVHENIYMSFNNITTLATGTSVLSDWKSNPYSETDDGFYYSNVSSATNDGILIMYDNTTSNQSSITYGDLDVIYLIMKLYDTRYSPDIYVQTTSTLVKYSLSSGQFLASGQSYFFNYHKNSGVLNKLRFNDPEAPRRTYDKISGTPANSEVITKIYLKFTGASGVLFKTLVIEGALYSQTSDFLINYYYTQDIQNNSDDAIIGFKNGGIQANLYAYSESNTNTQLTTRTIDSKQALFTTDYYTKTAYNSTATGLNTVGKVKSGSSYYDMAGDTSGVLSVNVENSPIMKIDGTTNTIKIDGTTNTVKIDGTTNSVKMRDTTGNTITSITTPSNCEGSLKTVLYGQQNNSAIGDTSTTVGTTTKVGLNAFITNALSTPVLIGGNDGTTAFKPIKVDVNGVQDMTGTIKDSGGSNAGIANVSKFNSNITNQNYGLNTNSLLYGYDGSLNYNQAISAIFLNSRENLCVYDDTVSTNITTGNGKLTTIDSTLTSMETTAETSNTSLTSIKNRTLAPNFFQMYFSSNAAGSFLMLTNDNSTAGTNTIGFSNTNLIPNFGTARSMWVIADASVPVNSKIRVYGIDLTGAEKIFYMTITAVNTNITTGTVNLDGTGGSVSLTTGLSFINKIEDIVPRNAGIIYVRSNVGAIATTWIRLGHYYIENPVYCVPKGRKLIIQGFAYIWNSTEQSYEFVIYKPNSNNTYSITFPYRTVIIQTSNYFNNYQWSDKGFVSVNELEYVFLNRETGATSTGCNLKVGVYEVST